MHIDVKHTRKGLNEGRTYNMGFAFLKRTGDDSYETVQPISPCKDYLNDIVWAEATQRPVTAYGLKYKPEGLFATHNEAYIAIQMCDYPHGGYGDYARLEKNLSENYPNIAWLINRVEETLGLEEQTKIEKAGDNLYVLTLPLYWTKYTYLISMFTLLVRLAQFYKGEDVKEFLDNFKDFPADAYLLSSARTKIDKILATGQLPELNMDQFNGGTDVHNCGIISAQLVFAA